MQIWKQIAKIYVQGSLLRGRDMRERTDKQMSRDTMFILKSHLLWVSASTVSDSGETGFGDRLTKLSNPHYIVQQQLAT